VLAPPRVLLIGLGLALASGVEAQEAPQELYRLQAGYQRWSPSLTGEVQKSQGTQTGSLVDLKDDLGIPDNRRFEIQVTLRMASGHKLRGSYIPLDYSGDVNIARTFVFGGSTYPVSTRVMSSFKGKLYGGEYEWDFMRGRWGYLGGIVGVRYLEADTVLLAPDIGRNDQDHVSAPLPVIGATVRLYFDQVSLGAEFSGLDLGRRGSLTDLDIVGRLHVSDRLAVGGGYRRLSVRAQRDFDNDRVLLGGWHYGIELSL